MSDAAPQLKLYNTLTREKETFAPLDRSNVRMYVCGPTVYDYAHIGNARPAIVFDVLYRLLRHVYGADHVTYVRNITDVDDKINARALRDHGGEIAAGRLSLNEAIRKVTEPTYDQYQKDVAALGCLQPTHQPRATEHIDGMVRMAQDLIDRGHAYLATGGEGREVLFDVASMPDYGRLSNRRLEDQQAGARVEVKDHKKNPGDFVLWKESSPNEPGWPAHFHAGGAHVDIFGRPGWHLECSVMSEAYLGREFDIHGGGLDLIFPHHENEIAQSRCAHGTDTMARVWMHNGFLQVEGRKMSKSDGNFVTIHELLETEKFGGRKWPGEVLRLAMLMTHYRQPIDFSVRRLEEAEQTLQKWADARKLASEIDWAVVGNRMVDPQPSAEVINAIADDMNVVEALACLHVLHRKAVRGDVEAAFQLVSGWGLLGFDLKDVFAHADVDAVAHATATPEIERQIDRRLAFIRAKNWAEADRIRDELLAQGIQLKDGKDPATGERVTTWEVKR